MDEPADIITELACVNLDRDPDHWIDAFQKELGITSAAALRLVGGDAYPNLMRYAKHSWEKKALRKLLNIPEDAIEVPYKVQSQDYIAKIEQRYKEACEQHEKLNKLKSKDMAIDRTDERVKRHENTLRERLLVTSNDWIPDDFSVQGIIDEIQHMLQQIESLLRRDDCDHDDSTLLLTVSNGRALQGIMLSKNIEEQLKVRQKLLAVPENVQLLVASHPQIDVIEQFSNQQQENEFMKTVDMLGYSAIVPSKSGGLWGVCVDTSIALSIKGKHDSIDPSINEPQDKGQQLYLSTVRYFTAPLASFAFSDSDLQLSSDALRDLRQIEYEILTHGAELITTKDICKTFFQKFGSHARRGPMHFGGAYWQKCSCKGFKHTENKPLGQIQRDAVRMQVFHRTTSNAQMENSAWESWISNHCNFDKCSEATISKTQLKSSKIGGDSKASSNLSVWKAGLVACNHKWSLIDCGTTMVPVWEIVEMNHSKQFQDAAVLADVLKRNWEEMNGHPDVENTNFKQAEVLNQVSIWNADRDAPIEKDWIQGLIDVKEDLIKVSMNPQAWPLLYLSQDPVQLFLKAVVDQQHSCPSTTDLDFVKLLMQQLIHRADLNTVTTHSMDFALKSQLSKWLYGANTQQHSMLPMECEDFKIFQTYLQQAIQLIEQCKKMKSNLQCYISVLTAAITRAINYFRQNLLMSEQKYEYLFVTTLVYPFKYSTSYTPVIINQLSQEELRYLCNLLRDKSDKLFKTLASKNLVKIQAFLFHLAIDIYLNDSQDIAEHQVLSHLLYLKNEIGIELESSVAEILFTNLPSIHIMDFLFQYFPSAHVIDILSKYLSSANAPSEWQLLETNLSRVANFVQYESGRSIENILKDDSQTSASQDTKYDETDVSEPFDSNSDEYYSCKEFQSESLPPLDDDLSAHSSEIQASESFQPEANVIELFKVLDIIQYHPQKLTLRDALSVKKETLETTKCSDPQKLYIFLLQKIMAYDYRSRNNQLCMLRNTTPKTSKLTDKDSDSSDDEDEFEIHPMDGLLALLHCADDFLRQDLMARLVDCKLSIPLILPDPFTGNLTFPLWAMRSIVKEWKSSFDGKIDFHEYPLVSYSAPIISFIRFGRQEKSKSKIMNTVISTSNHGHFFHRDCEGGNFKRLLGNGLIELCWYLPAGKETDIFPDLITFLNLHGNALEHSQQIAFLSEVSFMTFVFITKEDLNEESTKVLKKLSETPGGIVLCTSCQRSSFIHLKEDIPGDLLCVTLKRKNEDETKKALQNEIVQRLREKRAGTGKRLEDCIDSALKYSIIVDECKEELKKSQIKAQVLQELIADHSNPHQCAKEVMLPLQGKDLWQEWAVQDKEEHRRLYRGDIGIEEYGAQKLEKKKFIRKNQLQCTKHLSPLMEGFIMTLRNTTGDSRRYFLQCLKLYLNDLSRNTIEAWQQQHKEKRSQLIALQRTKHVPGKEALLKECKRKIGQLHKKIIDASLGLEHLLRELGQVYEAVQESPMRANMYSRLPKLAAEILIDGYPLELMDGDAAHVPLEWVTAVLQEANKLLAEPRVYVLSVLGLQSTGKSTLINTTFGLQFNVGAGRCTRGAFMQLLPISDELKEEINCDYVLVVDTEGLRAPELDSQKMQKHDNELATFVIGVANETIVNIYGEVPGDMDDILQTAVHAFIRMKSVKFNPSCQFVHQNVGAVAASDKSGMGRSKFTDKLDMMTSEAAKEEKREVEFEYFSDVIHFEEEKDVHHFPGLWNGIPPMAHVNPEYSDKALRLRSHLVKRIEQSHCVKKLSDIQTHIGDLWNALLHEKFVFSFKNTLEIAVYNSLEANYSQWSWRFRSEMLEWERNAGNEIKNSQGPDQLRQLRDRLLKDQLPAKVCEFHTKLEQEMDKFFTKSEQREMLSQWNAETKHRLQRLANKLKEHAHDFCQELISSQQARADGKKMKVCYEDEVLKKVKDLINEQSEEMLKKGKGSEDEVEKTLRAKFDEQWEGWMEDIARKFHGSEYSERVKDSKGFVLQNVQEAILEFHKNEESLVLTRLEQRPLNARGKVLYLRSEEQHVHIVPQKETWLGKQIKKTKEYFAGRSEVLKSESHRNLVLTVTNYAFDRVEVYLETLSRQRSSFNPSYVIELLEKLRSAIDERSNQQTLISFTKEYHVDMSLTVCGYAVSKFRDMVESFREQTDPIVYLTKELKTPLFRLFKNKFLQSADEKIAACALCDLLAISIEKEVKKSLPDVIFRNMESLPWTANKAALKAQILLDLGEEIQQPKSDLNNYFLHLKKEHFKDSLQKWLGKYTKEHCEQLHTYKQERKTRLVYLAQRELTRLVTHVEDQAHEATQHIMVKMNKSDAQSEQETGSTNSEHEDHKHEENKQTSEQASDENGIATERGDEEDHKHEENKQTSEQASDENGIATERGDEQDHKHEENKQTSEQTSDENGIATERGDEEDHKHEENKQTSEQASGENGIAKERGDEDHKIETGIDVEEWLNLFLSEKLTKELDVSELRRFHVFCDVKELRDIENFERELKHGLEVLQMRLNKKFETLTIDGLNQKDQENKPDEHLYKQLCGCTEQCPFCGEQCDSTDDEHKNKHHVIQHRPVCLAEYREVHSGEMEPNVCSSMVGSDTQFSNGDTNGEWQPYKDYQETYPNWSIPEDMSAKSAFYWKWFLGSFSDKIAIEFGAKDNKIPKEWKEYTWEQAKQELKKQYKI